MPTFAEVSALAGKNLTEEQVTATLSVITALAKSYCRASWTEDEIPEDVAAVIKTSTLRLLANPDQISTSQTMGAFSVDIKGAWVGWSIGELGILHRHRKRAI